MGRRLEAVIFGAPSVCNKQSLKSQICRLLGKYIPGFVTGAALLGHAHRHMTRQIAGLI